MDEILNCIILDDELLLRELLKRSVEWENSGLRLIAEASSAMEALELVDEFQPDLIFVDICMPIMNGIEFSSLVMQKYPHMKIIIITGHDDFDYARKSIKIGVSDFLLKPINAEEIKRTLTQVCVEIRGNRNRMREQSELRRQLEENFPLLKERFLNELLTGSLSEEDMENKKVYYGIDFFSNSFQVSIIELYIRKGVESEETGLLLQLQCLKYLDSFLNRDNQMLSFAGKGDLIVLINSDRKTFQSDFYERIRENLMSNFSCSLTIGVGSAKEGLESLSVSFREAETALSYKIVEGKNTVLNYSDINLQPERDIPDFSAELNDFTFHLKAGISEKANSIIENILREECSGGYPDHSDLQIPALNILSRILSLVREIDNSEIKAVLPIKEQYDTLLKIKTLPEMISYLSDCVNIITEINNLSNSRRTGKLISDVKKYLKENYSHFELSQNTVAQEYHVNSSYLSRKFKEETNRSFIDYLSRIRLDRAIALLQETDKRNYEISEDVGIADPHYFSLFFKKYMNMSISDYRRKMKEVN